MDRDFTPEDMEKNRTMAALGYVVFFLPLICCGGSKLGRYCANQGLILLVLMVLVSLLCEHLSRSSRRSAGSSRCSAGSPGSRCCARASSALVQLMTNGRVIELPYVGGFRLLP